LPYSAAAHIPPALKKIFQM